MEKQQVSERCSAVAVEDATVNNVMITINYSNITLKLTLNHIWINNKFSFDVCFTEKREEEKLIVFQ